MNGWDNVLITRDGIANNVAIFASGEAHAEGGKSFEVILESYNLQSEEKSALKTDIIKVNVNCRCYLPYFKTSDCAEIQK